MRIYHFHHYVSVAYVIFRKSNSISGSVDKRIIFEPSPPAKKKKITEIAALKNIDKAGESV